MYFAFDLTDTKKVDEVTEQNVDCIKLYGFNSIEAVEKFVDSNYSYIAVYNHSDKFPTPVDFSSKYDAQLEIIKCLQNN